MSKGTTRQSRRTESGADDGGSDRRPPGLLGRLLFGGILAFNGLNHFRNAEGMAGYAESKGVPRADLAVPFTGGMLVFGGLGIAAWRLPRLAAGAAASFLAATTPVMHDFWAADEEQKQSEMNSFLKNVAMLGGALAFLDRGDRE